MGGLAGALHLNGALQLMAGFGLVSSDAQGRRLDVEQATHEARLTGRQVAASGSDLGLCSIAGLGRPAGGLAGCRQLKGCPQQAH